MGQVTTYGNKRIVTRDIVYEKTRQGCKNSYTEAVRKTGWLEWSKALSQQGSGVCYPRAGSNPAPVSTSSGQTRAEEGTLFRSPFFQKLSLSQQILSVYARLHHRAML